MIDVNRITSFEISGIDMKDYPKFCDAFIEEATYREEDGTLRKLTDGECDSILEDNYDWFYDRLWAQIF